MLFYELLETQFNALKLYSNKITDKEWHKIELQIIVLSEKLRFSSYDTVELDVRYIHRVKKKYKYYILLHRSPFPPWQFHSKITTASISCSKNSKNLIFN